MKNISKRALLFVSALSLIGVAACSASSNRAEIADRVAAPAWLIERPVEAGPFILTARERMHERGEPATIYIEGSGEADSIRQGKLFNATPVNPVALHLTAMDKSKNLAYIARPCQFTGLRDEDGDCAAYWGDAQFSPTVLSAYDDVLSGIKARYGVTAFHLVGYNSGATIAGMLAATRNDVIDLRTVAPRFDAATMQSAIPALRKVPQHHFIGGQDESSQPKDFHAYLQALGNTECVEHTYIQESEHEKGWVNKWPELLKTKVPSCYIAPEPEFVPIEKPEPIYVPRIGGAKK